MMTTRLSIATIGDPILKRKATAIGNTPDRSLRSLIHNLIETVKDANGVGIAAPQVSESFRLFIVASRPNPRYPNAPFMEPTAMINPRILAAGEEVVKGWEGCLSVPGLRGLVPRSTSIDVEYLNIEGDLVRDRLTHFIARIFQHELDHLDGILFPERLESAADLYREAEYRRIIRGES